MSLGTAAGTLSPRGTSSPATTSAHRVFPPLSPSKFPPSAFRSTGLLLNSDADAAHASVSSI